MLERIIRPCWLKRSESRPKSSYSREFESKLPAGILVGVNLTEPVRSLVGVIQTVEVRFTVLGINTGDIEVARLRGPSGWKCTLIPPLLGVR